MPKKTKREKILAEHRRNVSHTDGSSSSYSFQIPQKQKEIIAGNTHELHVIQHDLMRTLILAAIAVCIELVLYWKLK
jgi:hypothetical protein